MSSNTKFDFFELDKKGIQRYLDSLLSCQYIVVSPIFEFFKKYDPDCFWYITCSKIDEEFEQVIIDFEKTLTGNRLLLGSIDFKNIQKEPTGIIMLDKADAMLAKINFS